MEKTQILLRLPQSLKKDLEEVARKKGISTTGLILIILNDYLESR